ncbi:hypothetical protein [Helicobacter sp. 23-1045]
MDCHDFAMQNLAMTENEAFLQNLEITQGVDCFGDKSPRNDGFCARFCNFRFCVFL